MNYSTAWKYCNSFFHSAENNSVPPLANQYTRKPIAFIFPIVEYSPGPIISQPMPSDFQSRINQYPVPLIVERIGCGRSVAYAWQAGDRTPEPWQQIMILEKLGEPPPLPGVPGVSPGRGRPRKAQPPAGS